jgi:hypothetical protein
MNLRRRAFVLSVLAAPVIGGCVTEQSRPSCPIPAALGGSFNPRSPSVYLEVLPGVNLEATAARLSKKYNFTYTIDEISIVSRDIKPRDVRRLRCEYGIGQIDFDDEVTIGLLRAPNKALERSR